MGAKEARRSFCPYIRNLRAGTASKCCVSEVRKTSVSFIPPSSLLALAQSMSDFGRNLQSHLGITR